MVSVQRYIADCEMHLVGNLQDIVRIGTVNPPGLHYREMVDLLSKRCRALGMPTKVHRVPDAEVRRVTGSAE